MKYSLALILLPCKILRKNKQQQEGQHAKAILREPKKGQIALLQEKIFQSAFTPKQA